MLELDANGKPIDFISVTEQLKYRGLKSDATREERKNYTGGQLDQAGGAAYISELFTFVPTASNADYYIGIVREKFLLRQLIQTCTEFAGRAYEEQGEVKTLLDEAEIKILKIGAEEQGGRRQSLRETQTERWREIVKGDKQVISGVSTGFENLDRLGFRLPKSESIIIGGPISSGKTSLILNIAKSLSIDREFLTAIFSKEMRRSKCVDSLTEIISGINTQDVANRKVSDAAAEKYRESGKLVASARIELFAKEDCSGMLFPQLMKEARKLKASRPELRFVMIDYDELFCPRIIARSSSKEIEVTNISAWASELAGELGVTVILLSQMTGDALRYAKGKAADGHAVAMMEEDGPDGRILRISKNRDDARDVEAYFGFTGANKRFTSLSGPRKEK